MWDLKIIVISTDVLLIVHLVSEPRSSKKVKKEKVVEKSMGKLPNETKKNYFERLDQNIHQAINTTMMEAKTLRKKRKL